VDSIGQACCPFVLGVLRDRFGDYRYGIEFTFALALGGVLAVMLLPGRSGKGSGSTKIAVPVALGSATPSRPL
jgi:hypothetical protein